jgi:hypothetical protein
MPKKPEKPADRPRQPRFEKPKPQKSAGGETHTPAASKKLLKELPSKEEMQRTILGLKKLGHQATAILGAAFLENAMTLLLKTHFRPLTQADERLLLEPPSGIIGTFAAKIRVAYAIKAIAGKAYHDLLLINDIRNVFAHTLHTITFDNTLVAQDCANLKGLATIYKQHALPNSLRRKKQSIATSI